MPATDTRAVADVASEASPDFLDAALEAPAETPPAWTEDHVATRLVEAFRTLDRMPRVRGPRTAGNHWPSHVVEWADHLAQAELPAAERREREQRRLVLGLRPDGAAIARMDAALEWLRDLRSADGERAALLGLWALHAARRRSVRALCRARGWQPATFYRQRGEALAWLTAALTSRGTRVF